MEGLNDHRHVHNQYARARGCVLCMYLIFVMTGQNIFNDGDEGVHLHHSDRSFSRDASMRNAR